MDTEKIIRKYQLRIIEKNGKTGVLPTSGKPTQTDIDYIKTHMAEIIATLTEWSKPSNKPSISDAQIARRTVDELEAKYRQAERNADSNATVIAARNAYEAALEQWQEAYPTEAAKSYSPRYNDGATNNVWN